MTTLSADRAGTTVRPDYLIALVVAVLTGAGLVFVFSASFAIGLREFYNVYFVILRQAIG